MSGEAQALVTELLDALIGLSTGTTKEDGRLQYCWCRRPGPHERVCEVARAALRRVEKRCREGMKGR